MLLAAFPPHADCTISQYYPDKNYDGCPSLFISQFQRAGDIYRSLLRFGSRNSINSLEQIPAGSEISRASLYLAIERNEVPAGSSILLKVFTVLGPWDNRTVTWNNQPLFHAVYEGAAVIASGYGVVKVDLTALVRKWFNRRIYNEGILLSGDESNNRLVAFYSKSARDNGLWPRLSVNYIPQ